MSDFDKEKFLLDRIKPTIDISIGLFKGDPDTVAKGVLDKVKPIYEDIIKNAKTEEEALEAIKKSKSNIVGFVHGGSLVAIDLLKTADLIKFNISDIFAGTSKEEGKDLHPEMDKSEWSFFFKNILGVAVDFFITKNIYGAIVSFFANVTDFATSNHIIRVDYYDKNNSGDIDNNISEKKYLVYNSSSKFEEALQSAWGEINSDMNSGKYRRVIFSRYNKSFKTNNDVEFIYHKTYKDTGKENTFEIRNGGKDTLISILKRIDYPNRHKQEAYVKFGLDKPQKILVNYLAIGSTTDSILSDLRQNSDKIKQAAAYALENLVGYVLEGENLPGGRYGGDLNLYSRQHLEDRVKFLSTFVKNSVNNITGNDRRYMEIKNGSIEKEAGKMPQNEIHNFIVNEVIFVTGSSNTNENRLSPKKSVYGSSGNDSITYKYGSNYIEAGLGSDTITTGSGNDTIYTNAAIEDKYDKEDKNTVNTVVAGRGRDKIYGSNGKDIIYADDLKNNGNGSSWTSDKDIVYGKGGDDEIYGGNDSDTIYGGSGSDELYGGDDDDTIYADSNDGSSKDSSKDVNFIYGGDGNDTLIGGDGVDFLYAGDAYRKDGTRFINKQNQLKGGGGNDHLYGSTTATTMHGDEGEDTLNGGNGVDTMYGGSDFDTYYAGHQDVIEDSDGKGEVYLGNLKLKGGVKTSPGHLKIYTGESGETYELKGSKLIITHLGKTLTINNFKNSKTNPHLGIYLSQEDEDIEITVSDASAQEMKGVMSFDISLSRTLAKGEYIDVLVKAKSDRQGSKEIEKKIRFKEDDKVKTFEYFWKDDEEKEEDEKISVSASVIDKSKKLKAEVKNQGTGTIEDDDGDEITVTVSDEEELEATGKMTFKVSLSRALKGGEYVNVSVNGENLEFLTGEQTKEYIKIWDDDKDKQGDRTINAVATVGDVSKGLKVSVKRHGVGTIKDDDGDKIYVSISDASAKESEQKMTFNVSLSRALNKGEFVKLVVNEEVIEFGANEQTKKYEYTWKDDKKVEADEKIDVLASVVSKSPGLDVEFFKKGVGTIEDDDGGEVTVYTTSASAPEAAEKMTFFVSISRPLKEGEYVVASIYGQTVHFYEGSSTNYECKYTWKGEDDEIPEEDSVFKLTPSILDHSPGLNVKTESGTGTIRDDDKDPDDNDPENPPIPRDPLAIDLNKDGTHTLKLDGALNFDIDGNGFKEATGWISPEDAFLAYDRNENGVIDDGTELFGDKTVTNTAFGYTSKAAENGFEALKAFDSNNDNIIDEKDEKFDKLLLWQDKNSNAVTDEGELKTLREHNIKSIDLNYQNINSTNNGNFIRQTSKVTFNDGTTTTADDIWFSVDLKDTIQPDIAISNDIRALPEVHGFGNLYNLRSAMSKDSKLAGMIKEYMSLSSDAKQEKLDDILFRWAQVEDIDKTGRGENIDARILGAYEKITGKPFLQFGNNPNPWASAAATIKNRVKQFKDYLYSSIELQSKYNGLLDTRYQYFNYDEKRLGYDFSKINRKLLQLYKDRKYEEVATLSDLVRKAGSYKPNLLDSFNASLTKLANGDKYFMTISSSVPLYNANSNDPLRGTNGNDLIVGNSGDDTLGKGDGVDTIYDVHGNDTIKFKEGISKEDIRVRRVDEDQNTNDIEISIKGTSDKIIIKNVYYDAGRWYNNGIIENFEFADGTKATFKELEARDYFKGTQGNDVISGANENDEIYGYGGDDYVYGRAGNDTIYGGDGNDGLYGQEGNDVVYGENGDDTLGGENGDDILYGGEGNDKLYGGDGNDTLEGGAGNDYLEGGYHGDVYVFGKGDGVDTIYDVHGNDTIKFKEGISKENLTFMFNGNNLSIRYGDKDSITVNNYTGNVAYQIEKIELEGGNFITNSQINKIIQDINAYAKDNGITAISHDTIRNNQDMMNLVMSGWNS